MQLSEAVDGSTEQRRRRVDPAVPARIVIGFAKPEVGAEIDHDRRRTTQHIDCATGLAVVERREHDVRISQRLASRESQLGAAAQRRVSDRNRLARKPLGCDLDDVDLRVAGEQAQQLAARVARLRRRLLPGSSAAQGKLEHRDRALQLRYRHVLARACGRAGSRRARRRRPGIPRRASGRSGRRFRS